MKFVTGSKPGNLAPVHVLRDREQPVPSLGDLSAGVSAIASPPDVARAQPPWNVWYSQTQWPTSCVSVSPPL